MTSGRTVPLPDFKLGIQLYGLQDNFRKDMRGTLKALAGFGYQGIELLAAGLDQPAEIAGNLRAAGLKAAGIYTGKPQLLIEAANTAADAFKTLGTCHLTCGYDARVERDWPVAIQELRRLAERAHEKGLVLNYHNHEQEYKSLQGRAALEILAEQTDPDRVQFELDTYFTLKMGEDPCRWIKRFAGRMTRLHLKDLNASDGSVAVIGDGILDVRAVVAEAVQGGVEWIVIEFHPGLANPLEMARLCLEGLRGAL